MSKEGFIKRMIRCLSKQRRFLQGNCLQLKSSYGFGSPTGGKMLQYFWRLILGQLFMPQQPTT